jgi:hypothetical protein
MAKDSCHVCITGSNWHPEFAHHKSAKIIIWLCFIDLRSFWAPGAIPGRANLNATESGFDGSLSTVRFASRLAPALGGA